MNLSVNLLMTTDTHTNYEKWDSEVFLCRSQILISISKFTNSSQKKTSSSRVTVITKVVSHTLVNYSGQRQRNYCYSALIKRRRRRSRLSQVKPLKLMIILNHESVVLMFAFAFMSNCHIK